MKNFRLLLVPVLVVFFAASGFSFNAPKEQKDISDNSVSSLLVGVESQNFGLQTSSAYMLGEIRSSRAVIPLMHMLHSSEKEEARIMAAISLAKIDSKKGIFAVKQASKFDESARVRRICFSLYMKSLGIEPVSSTKDIASK